MTGRRLTWVALGIVVVVFLVVGSVRPAPPPTVAGRAAVIEAQIRCPSCEGISVAQSSAATAVAIRQAVTARLAAGQSDQQIESFLVARYGPSILLSPPVSGGVGLVWFVPAAGLVLAAAGLGVFFWRRRRLEPVVVTDADRTLVAHELEGRGS